MPTRIATTSEIPRRRQPASSAVWAALIATAACAASRACGVSAAPSAAPNRTITESGITLVTVPPWPMAIALASRVKSPAMPARSSGSSAPERSSNPTRPMTATVTWRRAKGRAASIRPASTCSTTAVGRNRFNSPVRTSSAICSSMRACSRRFSKASCRSCARRRMRFATRAFSSAP